MTAPVEIPDLLVTPAELEVWVQEPAGSLATDEFTLKVLWGVSVLIRDYGLDSWTHANLPERARLIAQVTAKNYYEHPTGAISEGTGPISERFIDDVVHSMTLPDEQITVLERLAAEAADTPGDIGGLQTLTTTRGPVEMTRRRGRPIYVRDAQGNAIAYYDERDAYAFMPLADLGYLP